MKLNMIKNTITRIFSLKPLEDTLVFSKICQKKRDAVSVDTCMIYDEIPILMNNGIDYEELSSYYRTLSH